MAKGVPYTKGWIDMKLNLKSVGGKIGLFFFICELILLLCTNTFISLYNKSNTKETFLEN